MDKKTGGCSREIKKCTPKKNVVKILGPAKELMLITDASDCH